MTGAAMFSALQSCRIHSSDTRTFWLCSFFRTLLVSFVCQGVRSNSYSLAVATDFYPDEPVRKPNDGSCEVMQHDTLISY